MAYPAKGTPPDWVDLHGGSRRVAGRRVNSGMAGGFRASGLQAAPPAVVWPGKVNRSLKLQSSKGGYTKRGPAGGVTSSPPWREVRHLLTEVPRYAGLGATFGGRVAGTPSRWMGRVGPVVAAGVFGTMMTGAVVRRWCGGGDREHPEGNSDHAVEVGQLAEHLDGSMERPRGRVHRVVGALYEQPGWSAVDEAEWVIPHELLARLCSAAAAAGIGCDGQVGLSVSDVLAWLDREGWSWQVGHAPGGPWTCLNWRDTWPGLVHTRLHFLGDEEDSAAEAVTTACFRALACSLVARDRRYWGETCGVGKPLSTHAQVGSSELASAQLAPDQARALRRAFLLSGLEWPFGSEVSVEVVVRWLWACGWEVDLIRCADAVVRVRRTVGLVDGEVVLEECFSGSRGGDAEPLLEEAVTDGALWAFAVAQCELKGFRLAREASYGRLGPDGSMALLALMSRAGEPWPFSLSPGVFELTGWLEQQGWEWSLCRNNLPEHVLDDPDWRRHQWVLILSGHGRHGLAYRGETVEDLFLGVLRDLLEGGEEGVELPDFDNPPDDEELLDVPPLDDEEVMLAIRAADRRFEPPAWMVERLQRLEDGAGP